MTTPIRDHTLLTDPDRMPTLFDHIMALHERISRLEALIHPVTVSGVDTLIGWNYDPTICVAPALLGNPRLATGTLYVQRVPLSTVSAISRIHFAVALAGNVTTALCAVYSEAGTRLGVTENIASAFNSAGNKTVSLGTPTAAITDDYVLTAFLVVSVPLVVGTGPSIAQAAADPDVASTSASAPRYSTAGGGHGSTPSSLGAKTASDQTLWVALS